MRGATLMSLIIMYRTNFNSHAPCGAQLNKFQEKRVTYFISTHTPHAGRNLSTSVLVFHTLHFNSHAPCGAQQLLDRKNSAKNFNSHAPCGAQPPPRPPGRPPADPFQLTRPMRGATAFSGAQYAAPRKFQLTRPMRGATR